MIEEEFIAMLNLQFAAALYPNNQNAPVPQDNSTSIFSNLSNTSQVSTQQNFPIQVALEDETLAVLYRISTLGDIENLSEETENRILAALNIVEIAALKTDIPIVRVSSTLSGTDSWQNITYIELMDNIRQQVQGELTREERLETIVKKTTPFWEWHGIGEVDLFSQEQLLTRSKSAIVKDLKLDGRINVQDQSLFFDLKTLKSSLSDDEVRQKTQNLFETVEDDVLLAIPAIDNLVLKITDNSDDSTICFGRDMGAARHYRENIIDKNSYELSLIQLDKSQCP